VKNLEARDRPSSPRIPTINDHLGDGLLAHRPHAGSQVSSGPMPATSSLRRKSCRRSRPRSRTGLPEDASSSAASADKKKEDGKGRLIQVAFSSEVDAGSL